MYGATVGTFVKGLVVLAAAVTASDFDDDFFFHYFLSDYLLLCLGWRRVWERLVPGAAYSDDEISNCCYDGGCENKEGRHNDDHQSFLPKRQLHLEL